MVGKNPIARQSVVRTTLDLPVDLLERSNRLVDRGKAKSRNTLFVAAVQGYLDELEKAEIDAAFADMGRDMHYRALSERVAGEFALSDSEALIGSASQIADDLNEE